MLVLLLLAACGDPSDQLRQQVGYRDPLDPGPNSGERGTIKITEILWSGSVRTRNGDHTWDPDDVFVELRNESNRPVNLTDWTLVLSGGREVAWRIPENDLEIEVGDHVFIAAKSSGCFPEPDYVIPGLAFAKGDPIRLTLYDADERLIEPAGDAEMPPFAGGYDLAVSRSMERIELMFGGQGTQPQMWHHYTQAEADVPNNDRVHEDCQRRTWASPGRANSPDYSGAFAGGSFE